MTTPFSASGTKGHSGALLPLTLPLSRELVLGRSLLVGHKRDRPLYFFFLFFLLFTTSATCHPPRLPVRPCPSSPFQDLHLPLPFPSIPRPSPSPLVPFVRQYSFIYRHGHEIPHSLMLVGCSLYPGCFRPGLDRTRT